MTRYKNVFLIFLLLFFSQGHMVATSHPHICEQLKQVPVRDCEVLTLFFETLLSNNFAYTLFGDKPVSCDTFPLEGDGSRKCSCLNYGKKIWDQYSSLFSSSKFIIKSQLRDMYGIPHVDIFLINKEAFIQTVSQHLSLFQLILGSDITPERLLDTIAQENTEYTVALRHHSGLIGLLYGFGYTNAFAYHKIDKIECDIEKWLQPPSCFFTNEVSLELYKNPINYFQNLDSNESLKLTGQIPAQLKVALDTLSHVNMVHEACPEEDPLSLINLSLYPLPAFGADIENRADTNILIERYKKTRRDIVYAYNQGDFLEVTLCKLIEK